MNAVLKFKYGQIINQLLLLQDHAPMIFCPYRPKGNFYIWKHPLDIEAYAYETEPAEDDKCCKKKLETIECQERNYRAEEEAFLDGRQTECSPLLEDGLKIVDSIRSEVTSVFREKSKYLLFRRIFMKNKSDTDSSHNMLSWQLKTLLGEIQQIELHETGDCPCILNTEEPPERCLGKHLLNISTLSQETANMDSQNKEWLLKLAKEANERHEQFKEFICHIEDLPQLTEWARNWRKQYIEPIYYTCKVKLHNEATLEDATTESEKQISGLNSIAVELPVDGNTPATSCSIREDRKN